MGTTPSHPANLIPPLTTKHASALSVDGTPSLARCRDFELFRLISKELFIMTHRAAEPTRQTAAEKSAGAEKNKNWIVVVTTNDRGFEITGIRSKMHGNKTLTNRYC